LPRPVEGGSELTYFEHKVLLDGVTSPPGGIQDAINDVKAFLAFQQPSSRHLRAAGRPDAGADERSLGCINGNPIRHHRGPVVCISSTI
jgi:hypothetical protein